MPSKETLTKSGITTAPTGERHIPASQRPDGSTRREIKIRPGYKPPEDVEVYKNSTADAWKTRGSGGVPGAATASDGAEGKGDGGSASSNKNAKRREARKKAKSSSAVGPEEPISVPETSESNETPPAPVQPTPPQPQDDTEDVDAEKQARKLQKKLRQARELAVKKASGEALLPEQVEKVIRINELVRQLDGLGFDAEGERKVKGVS
ncbi:MAG: hypothetical protein M1832_001462 [Thelocarpon impressellum]|nr:MAG: hypothetical protein M1832_001462 [Thelocarpon impressellum]